MPIEVIIKNGKKAPKRPWKPSAHTAALHLAKGVDNGSSVEWNVSQDQILTPAEVVALRKKRKRPNLERATKVKRLMQQGKSRKWIAVLLGKQYGERMIAEDHAILKKFAK